MDAATPPNNIEAEAALLGSLMSHGDAIVHVAPILKPEHFFEPLHARIYDAILKAFEQGIVPSPLTLKARFEADDTLNEIGGWAYLSKLTSFAAPSLSVESVAQTIRELAERREMIITCDELALLASDPGNGEDHHKAAAEAVTRLSGLLDGGSAQNHVFTLGEASEAVLRRLERAASGEPDPDAIPTGLESLDEVLGGLVRSRYYVLAGRPSMGKSAVGAQMALNIAQAGLGVAYFSLEMPAADLSTRIISSDLWHPDLRQIPYGRIAKAQVTDQQRRWVEDAVARFNALPIEINERPAMTAGEIEAQARVMAARFARNGTPIGAVIVDHLHKMTEPASRNPVEAFTRISATLAAMAKRLHVPVLALAQLNRGVEAREDKRPTLADLRESGSIEQDANAVIFAFREAYYLERQSCRKEADELDRLADLEATRNRLELIIAKHREGAIGTVTAWCDMACNVVRDDLSEGARAA